MIKKTKLIEEAERCGIDQKSMEILKKVLNGNSPVTPGKAFKALYGGTETLRTPYDEKRVLEAFEEGKEQFTNLGLDGLFDFATSAINEKIATKKTKDPSNKQKIAKAKNPYANLPKNLQEICVARDKRIEQFKQAVEGKVLTNKSLEILTQDANKKCECEMSLETHKNFVKEVDDIFYKVAHFAKNTEDINLFVESVNQKFLQLQKQGKNVSIESIEKDIVKFVKEQEKEVLGGTFQKAVNAALKEQREVENLLPVAKKLIASDVESIKRTKILSEELSSFRANPENEKHLSLAQKLFGYDTTLLIDCAKMKANAKNNEQTLQEQTQTFKNNRDIFQKAKLNYRDFQTSMENYFERPIKL